MADRGDPLGKRALFWAPGNAGEDLIGTEPASASGKRALYSTPPAGSAPKHRRSRPGRGRVTPAGGATPAAPAAAGGQGAGAAVVDGALGLLGTVVVDCGSCGGRRRVDLLRYARLHVPAFLVRPGRGFTHFMTCPTCGRRTWVSASWKLPGR